MHVHIGAASAIASFLTVILVGTIWRIGALLLKNTAVGQTMAFMY